MTSAMVFGSTGLCGREILKYAVSLDKLSTVFSVSRRDTGLEAEKLHAVVAEADSYPEVIAKEKPDIVFASLATTRAVAGSAQAFVDTDYGINYNIAKAARDAGVNTFVLISSAGASALSPFLYFKTKGRLEDDVIALKFPRTIILRPGALLGERDKAKGFLTDLSASVFKHFHGTFLGRAVLFPIYGSEVGRAAVHLAEQPSAVPPPEVEAVGPRHLLRIVDALPKV